MKNAKVTTQSGYSWTTDINGSNQSIRDYFLGKSFNVGVYPAEKMERVKMVEVDENYKAMFFGYTEFVNGLAELETDQGGNGKTFIVSSVVRKESISAVAFYEPATGEFTTIRLGLTETEQENTILNCNVKRFLRKNGMKRKLFYFDTDDNNNVIYTDNMNGLFVNVDGYYTTCNNEYYEPYGIEIKEFDKYYEIVKN